MQFFLGKGYNKVCLAVQILDSIFHVNYYITRIITILINDNATYAYVHMFRIHITYVAVRLQKLGVYRIYNLNILI